MEGEIKMKDSWESEHSSIPEGVMCLCGLCTYKNEKAVLINPELNKISSISMPAEFGKAVDEHFWELI
jgi:hypothetical protein